MVTEKQWLTTKLYAIGFAILLLAFLIVEIVSYVSYRDHYKDDNARFKGIQEEINKTTIEIQENRKLMKENTAQLKELTEEERKKNGKGKP